MSAFSKKSRPRSHDAADDHDEHIDERWLVSYADMMTLLFGLFVMLFSIASENQGKFDEQLQQISKSTFNKTPETPAAVVPPTPPPVPVPVPVPVVVPPPVVIPDTAPLKEEIEGLKTERETLRQQVEDREQMRKERDELQAQLQIKEELLKKIPKAPKPNQKLNAQVVELETNLKEEQKKSQELQALADELRAQVKENAEKIKLSQKELKKTEEIKRSVASVSSEKKDLEQKQAESETQLRELAQQKTELEHKNEELTAKQKEMDLKVQALAEKVAEMEKQAKNQSQFMMIVLKWSSEKHDLDLTVTDPEGHAFNFKNRKFPGSPGEFTLDSRSGPGAEIWQTDKIIPGIYLVSWKLYNNYGNENPVVYSGVISTNKGNIQIPETKMEAKGGAKASLKVKVDASGSMNRLD